MIKGDFTGKAFMWPYAHFFTWTPCFLEAALQGRGQCVQLTHEETEAQGHEETTLGHTARKLWGSTWVSAGLNFSETTAGQKDQVESSPLLDHHPLDGASALQQDITSPQRSWLPLLRVPLSSTV